MYAALSDPTPINKKVKMSPSEKWEAMENYHKITSQFIYLLHKSRQAGEKSLQARSNPSDELSSDERAADATGNAQLEGGFREEVFSG